LKYLENYLRKTEKEQLLIEFIIGK